MPRLRITIGLSLLGLAIGIAGTAWLSTLGEGWAGPRLRMANATSNRSIQAHARPSLHDWHGPVSVVQHRRVAFVSLTIAKRSAPELVPLTTAADHSQPWYKLRGHLDGRVVVHLSIEPDGGVRGARVAASSGDPVLDAHALRSVQGWTFAVPPDYPDGFSGDLPMRFSSRQQALARVP